jgi:hypothetical protein
MSQKNADVIYIAAEAGNNASQEAEELSPR